MTSNIFGARWEINSFTHGPISSCKPFVILRWYPSHLKDALIIYTRSILGSHTDISQTCDISFDSCLYGLCWWPMWSVFRVSLCQKSVSLPLSPCLSLLLSSYPLTHILVITSGVPCRNSITPPLPSSSDIKLSPCPWTQDQRFSFSAALWFWQRETGRCLFLSSAPWRDGCYHYMPFDPSCQFTWSSATGLLSPARLPDAPRGANAGVFHGSRCTVVNLSYTWVCVCECVWAKAPGLLSYYGTARLKRSPVWQR